MSCMNVRLLFVHSVLGVLALCASGCDDASSDGDSDGGADSAADSDSDTDTDSDADSGADAGVDYLGSTGDVEYLGPYGGAVMKIAESPASPGTVYAVVGTHANMELYSSADEGKTWSPVEVSTDYRVLSLLILESGRIIAGTDLEILASDDDGATWENIRGNIEEGWGYGIAVKGLFYAPGDPGRLWAALANYDSAPIWSLADGDTEWVPWNAPEGWDEDPLNGPAQFTSISASFDEESGETRIFTTFELCSSAGGGVFCSLDSGETFANCSSGLPSVPFADVVTSEDTVAVAGGNPFADAYAGVYFSLDNGASWTESTTAMSKAVANDLVRLSNGDYMVAMYGTGLWRTTALDASWSRAGDLGEMTVNSVAELSGGAILTGPEQLGVYRSEDQGETWQASSMGFNMIFVSFADVDPVNPDETLIAVNSDNSGLCLHTESGIDGWATIQGMPMPRYSFIDIAASGRWYAVSDGPTTQQNDGILVSTDKGESFEFLGPLKGSLMDHNGIFMAELESAEHLIAAGNYWSGPPFGFLMESEDAGQTWSVLWETEGDGSDRPVGDFIVLSDGSYLLASSGDPIVRVAPDGTVVLIPIEAQPHAYIYDMAACAGDPDVWYALGMDTKSLTYFAVATTDGGATWQAVPFTGFETETAAKVELHPWDCDLAFLLTGTGAIRSTRDLGASWEAVDIGDEVTPSNLRVVGLGDELDAALLVWGLGGVTKVALETTL